MPKILGRGENHKLLLIKNILINTLRIINIRLINKADFGKHTQTTKIDARIRIEVKIYFKEELIETI
jgi:hypothetical protein